jgi:hypothetical protein
MTGVTVHRQSHEAGRNSMPPLAESGIAPRPKAPTADFVPVWLPHSLSAAAAQVRVPTKPTFGDPSATRCGPSHQSGQVVVFDDIVM